MEAGGQGQVALRFAPALTHASSSGPVQQAHDKRKSPMQSRYQNKKTLSADDLAQFTGTEQWYRHSINSNCSLHRRRAICRRTRAKRIGFWTKSL